MKENFLPLYSVPSQPDPKNLATPSEPDKSFSEIIPGKLYLGSFIAAQNKQLLQSHSITHVLNITVTGDCFFTNEFNYLNIKLADCHGGIKPYLDQAADFIPPSRKTRPFRAVI